MIKRCPDASNDEKDGHNPLRPQQVADGIAIVCPVCKNRGPSGKTNEEAIELWNSAKPGLVDTATPAVVVGKA